PVGNNSASLTTPALTTTTSYWVQVSDPGNNLAKSDTAVITVVPPTKIDTAPASTSVYKNQSATLTVAASGDTLSYQWYQGTSGDTRNPVTGAINGTYATPELTTAANYWVRVSGSNGSADSSTVTVGILPKPSITTQPRSQTIYTHLSATLTVVATGDPAL